MKNINETLDTYQLCLFSDWLIKNVINYVLCIKKCKNEISKVKLKNVIGSVSLITPNEFLVVNFDL